MPARVVEYRAEGDLYILELSSLSPPSSPADDSKVSAAEESEQSIDDDLRMATKLTLPPEGSRCVTVSLHTTLHRWYDEDNSESAFGARFDIKVHSGDSVTHAEWLVRRSRPNESRWSCYPTEVLNEFHRQGGLLMMFQSLREYQSDTISPSSASSTASTSASVTIPTFRTILLHLRLCTTMKSYTPIDTFRVMTWEAKE